MHQEDQRNQERPNEIQMDHNGLRWTKMDQNVHINPKMDKNSQICVLESRDLKDKKDKSGTLSNRAELWIVTLDRDFAFFDYFQLGP